MATTPEKRRLRAATIAAILAIDESRRQDQERGILSRIAALDSFGSAKSVLLYIRAFPEEIETGPLIAEALNLGKRVACPRVDRREGLILHEIHDPARDLISGILGIPEPRREAPILAPEEIDWVLAPGVAFDSRCNRVGRGAGHYDRLLPKIRSDVEVWAAAFDAQILDVLPVEPHDVPLHGVVTATRTFVRD